MVLFLKFQRTTRKREIEMRGSKTERSRDKRKGGKESLCPLAVPFCLITFQVSDAVSDFLYNVVPYATKIQ